MRSVTDMQGKAMKMIAPTRSRATRDRRNAVASTCRTGTLGSYKVQTDDTERGEG